MEKSENLQENFNALKRIHDATNNRIIQLEQEVNRLKALNEILNAEKKQWEIQKELQAQIIQQALNNSNATNKWSTTI